MEYNKQTWRGGGVGGAMIGKVSSGTSAASLVSFTCTQRRTRRTERGWAACPCRAATGRTSSCRRRSSRHRSGSVDWQMTGRGRVDGRPISFRFARMYALKHCAGLPEHPVVVETVAAIEIRSVQAVQRQRGHALAARAAGARRRALLRIFRSGRKRTRERANERRANRVG